ncbi:MAG: hypothetical protein ACMXYF_04150 [Candidatus Woesearchaeota archaeon]
MFDKLKFWKKEDDVDSILSRYAQEGEQQAQQESAPGAFDQSSMQSSFDSPQPNQMSQSSFDSQQSSQQTQPFGQSSLAHDTLSQQQAFSQTSQDSSFQPQFSGYEQPQQSSTSQSSSNDSFSKRDTELILSRLDLIRAELENVQHRLTVLEQHVKGKKYW